MLEQSTQVKTLVPILSEPGQLGTPLRSSATHLHLGLTRHAACSALSVRPEHRTQHAAPGCAVFAVRRVLPLSPRRAAPVAGAVRRSQVTLCFRYPLHRRPRHAAPNRTYRRNWEGSAGSACLLTPSLPPLPCRAQLRCAVRGPKSSPRYPLFHSPLTHTTTSPFPGRAKYSKGLTSTSHQNNRIARHARRRFVCGGDRRA